MNMRMLIVARNVWQALDWLAKTTGRCDATLHVSSRRVELGRLRITVLTPEDYENCHDRIAGCEFNLVIFLHECPLDVRNFVMTRWRP